MAGIHLRVKRAAFLQYSIQKRKIPRILPHRIPENAAFTWSAGLQRKKKKETSSALKTEEVSLVEEGGFGPPKVLPTDLQSAPFGHSGTPPRIQFLRFHCLGGAGGRTRTPDLLITNQLLYQLSYTSKSITLNYYNIKTARVSSDFFEIFSADLSIFFMLF